jgi:hypothetical protein
VGGICHPNLNQSLADRMFCPTPYPRLTHSLPSLTLTQYRSRRRFRLYRNQCQHFLDQQPMADRQTLWPSYALFAEPKTLVPRIVEGLCFGELRRAWRMHIVSSKLSCSS